MWPEYVPVAQKRAQAEKVAAKLRKGGKDLSPIVIEGSAISKSVWGKAWCKHLESFSDYANRLPRGRSYVRHGSVIDLKIDAGNIEALIHGSDLYRVKISIAQVVSDKWQRLIKACSSEIASIIELLQGRLPSSIMSTITHQSDGLFPLPKEISLKCSCPDSASMCKHIAATLYGVGARLDSKPELLFVLRGVNHAELITNVAVPTTKSAKSKVIKDADLAGVFGIDIEASSQKTTKKPSAARSKESSDKAKRLKPKTKKALEA